METQDTDPEPYHEEDLTPEDAREIERELERKPYVLEERANLLAHTFDRYPHIRDMDEFNALFLRYQAAEGAEKTRLRDELVYRNIGLVYWIAKKFRGRGLPEDDLVQEGLIGLMKTLPRFQPERGFRFSTYAFWWIRQGMTRAILDQRMDRYARIPAHTQESLSRFRTYTASYAAKHGCTPSDEDVAAYLGLSMDRIVQLKTYETIYNRRPISLAQKFGPDGSWEFLDFFKPVDPSDPISLGPDMHLHAHARMRATMNAVNKLPPKLKDIICRRYGLGMSEQNLRQIGSVYKLTRERMRQLESMAFRKLGHALKADREELSALLELAEAYLPFPSGSAAPD